MGGRRLDHEKVNKGVRGPVTSSGEIAYREAVENYLVNYEDEIAWKRGFHAQKGKLKNCPQDFEEFRKKMKHILDFNEKFKRIFSSFCSDIELQHAKFENIYELVYFNDDYRIKILILLESSHSGISGDIRKPTEFIYRTVRLGINSLNPNNFRANMLALAEVLAEQGRWKESGQ